MIGAYFVVGDRAVLFLVLKVKGKRNLSSAGAWCVLSITAALIAIDAVAASRKMFLRLLFNVEICASHALDQYCLNVLRGEDSSGFGASADIGCALFVGSHAEILQWLEEIVLSLIGLGVFSVGRALGTQGSVRESDGGARGRPKRREKSYGSVFVIGIALLVALSLWAYLGRQLYASSVEERSGTLLPSRLQQGQNAPTMKRTRSLRRTPSIKELSKKLAACPGESGKDGELGKKLKGAGEPKRRRAYSQVPRGRSGS